VQAGRGRRNAKSKGGSRRGLRGCATTEGLRVTKNNATRQLERLLMKPEGEENQTKENKKQRKTPETAAPQRRAHVGDATQGWGGA